MKHDLKKIQLALLRCDYQIAFWEEQKREWKKLEKKYKKVAKD